MPYPKQGKTVSNDNTQLRVGLPDILIDAVVRHYALLEAADDSGGGGGEGPQAVRVNQHDADKSAARDLALLAATEDCIAYLGAHPAFVARVTHRLRVDERLKGKIDLLLKAIEEQKVKATNDGGSNLVVPNYALMLSVVTIINLQRKIDELQRTAAVDVVSAAVVSPEQPGGTLSAKTPLNAVGVSPDTLEKREVGVEHYIEKLGVPEFADILRDRMSRSFDAYFKAESSSGKAVSGPQNLRKSMIAVHEDPYLGQPVHGQLVGLYQCVRSLIGLGGDEIAADAGPSATGASDGAPSGTATAGAYEQRRRRKLELAARRITDAIVGLRSPRGRMALRLPQIATSMMLVQNRAPQHVHAYMQACGLALDFKQNKTLKAQCKGYKGCQKRECFDPACPRGNKCPKSKTQMKKAQQAQQLGGAPSAAPPPGASAPVAATGGAAP